jgi:hypothetical protein
MNMGLGLFQFSRNTYFIVVSPKFNAMKHPWGIFICLPYALSIINEIQVDDSFIETKIFDEDAYNMWPTLGLLEKLPYILDNNMKQSFRAEYKKLRENEIVYASSESSVSPGVSVNTLKNTFAEFVSPSEIDSYFKECDVDKNDSLDIIEYFLCRGSYDAMCTSHGLGEYDVLESIIIHDYEEKRNDPNFRLPGVKYDENGIIID